MGILNISVLTFSHKLFQLFLISYIEGKVVLWEIAPFSNIGIPEVSVISK